MSEKLDPEDDERKIVNEPDPVGRMWRGGSKEDRDPNKYGKPSEEVEEAKEDEQ